MLKKPIFQSNRHSFFCLKYNLVVNTFEERKIINYKIEKELKNIIFENLKSHKCLEIKIEVKENKSVEISFQAPPQIQLSVLVNNLKTVSSRLIRKEFKEYLEDCGMTKHLWDLKYRIYT